MKHFPSTHAPARIEGLTHTAAPREISRRTAMLAALVLFAAGFFVGAIAFGTVLVRHTDAVLRAQSKATP